ncbi:bifunctional protein-serine/threonine kinase/phosphatase [Polaromonas sp.]|uniref:bifunctional protein-serine/threonine kinase/phosphatase n=1 Tax=Polaromonas sp. TaxID=1869339 RepID=UPI002FC90043
MTFEIDIGFTSLTGRKDVNEDFAAAMLAEAGQESMGAIAAIADGVTTGGMGREAAQTTVTSLVRDYFGTPETWDTTVALDRIIGAQNAWLAGLNRRRHPAIGLTTLTAVVLRGQSYALAHVGDTRAYLLREGRMTQLTSDHVVNHPDFSHQLLRAVGAEDRLVVDYAQGDLQVGDVFVLLSDGVHNVLPDKRLQTLAGPTPGHEVPADAQRISQQMVNEAVAVGTQDNATALVVRVLGLLDATLQDENRQALALPVPPRLKVGDTLDGMTVTAPLADNGINLLYQVRDAKSQRLYALKTLHPARAHDPEERAMLAHEAWLAKRMQSSRAADYLVNIHERLPNAQTPSAFYLLYDWHAGETLQQLLGRQHKLGLPQVLTVATQVAKALGRLHRQNVIHRDIKPANLHQGEDGVLRLLDLGVALTGREPEAMRRLHAGTPSYINPEQWGFSAQSGSAGNEGPEELPDAQSDLFALGVTLYQLLTGKLPYGEVLPYQSGRYYRDPKAPSRHNPEVPIWLDHVVLKAVARDKQQRFETAEELLLALERGASRPLTAPPATPLIQRDPAALWKIGVVVSVLFNLLLVYWLLFLPK